MKVSVISAIAVLASIATSAATNQYVSGEIFSSYSEMSREGFLLRHYRLLFSLIASALEICLGSNNSKFLQKK
jgi:hypothetical protein